MRGATTFDLAGWEVSVRDASVLAAVGLVVTLTGALLYLFLRTNLGMAMRATGDNVQMIRALGVNDGNMIVFGVAISNGFVALSGALLAQYQGFADVGMGIGMVVWGLASVIIGEALVGTNQLGTTIIGAVMGSVLFRLLVAVALRWGLSPNDLKLITARVRLLRPHRAAIPAQESACGVPMLEIQGVAKTFNSGTPNEVRSLRGVNLELAAGSWVIIIGTNGSGKSTLLNAVAGTFLVDEGTIRLAGRDVTRWPEHARAELIGRVFQNPFSGTSPSLTIEENLSLAALRGRGRGLGWGLKQSLVGRMRDEVSRLNMGLENRLENAIGSLSGGQRQALTLLMATWLRPELLLLDEHTAALDPKSADLVIALTEQVVARDQLTTLMVTHSMHQAASLGDRLIMMHRGQIIHDFQGAEKRRLRPDDLLARFEEVRRAEQLDESAAQMLAEQYI